jgi:hypothetical protein
MEKQPQSVVVVTVWNKSYEITVYRKSETVWIAVGEYGGERIETRGPSERTATARWREAARYRGN